MLKVSDNLRKVLDEAAVASIKEADQHLLKDQVLLRVLTKDSSQQRRKDLKKSTG
jgi:hypothetical protein